MRDKWLVSLTYHQEAKNFMKLYNTHYLCDLSIMFKTNEIIVKSLIIKSIV